MTTIFDLLKLPFSTIENYVSMLNHRKSIHPLQKYIVLIEYYANLDYFTEVEREEIKNRNFRDDLLIGDINMSPEQTIEHISNYLKEKNNSEDKNKLDKFESIVSSEKCQYAMTYSLYNEDAFFFPEKLLTIQELVVELQNRKLIPLDIENDENDYDYDILNEILKTDIPSCMWQSKAMDLLSTFSEDEKNLLESYRSYGYTQINNILRHSQLTNTYQNNLNIAMLKIPKLEQDIIVYRWINNDYLDHLSVSEQYIHYGYISTSLSCSFIVKRIINSHLHIMMKILVPRGTHCIYIGSDEKEILLANASSLKLISISEDLYVDIQHKSKLIKTYEFLFEN